MAKFDTTLYDYARDNHIHCDYGLYDAYDVCKQFEDRYIVQFNKPLNILDPDWAYWFAKFIINDHWPAGELLICQDSELALTYRVMINFEMTAGILGHSKDGIKEALYTVKKKKIDINDVADFVDAEMQQFRKQAKIRIEELKELLTEV